MHAAKLDPCKGRRMTLDFDARTEHRWSELVPPRTALTFAAIWDPEEGMVTFSGAHLLDSETDKGQAGKMQNDSPCDVAFTDDQSQVLTIDRFAIAITESSPTCPGYAPPSAGVDSLAFARDALVDAETVMDSYSCFGSAALRVPPGINSVPDSPAAASSMALASMANMHVPFRKTPMHNPFQRRRETCSGRPGLHVHTDGNARHYEERDHDDGADSDVTDEGFFEDRRLTTGTFGTAPVLVEVNLSSAFSVTTTSTSRYIEVDLPSQAEEYSCERTLKDSAPSVKSSAWSTLRDAERQICFNVPLELGRKLKKQHRSPRAVPPVDPAEVLARRCYNHVPSPASSSSSSAFSTWSGRCVRPRDGEGCGPKARASLLRTKSLLNKVVPGNLNLRKHGGEGQDERWVYVEVEHKVKQRVCAVSA